MTGGAANRHDLPPTSDKLPDPAKGSVASQPQPEATPKVAPGTRGRRQIDYRSVELELLRREVIGLRPQVAQQKAIIKELEGRLKEQSNQLHQANSRITQLEAALRQAQGPNSLLAKLGELQSTVQEVRDWQRQFLTDEWQPRLPDLVEIRQAAERQNGYERLVRRIQQVVHSLLPRNAAVLVLSKGDEALVNLPGVQGWHFLQAEDGSYAGYYPADSTEAINHLEALRARGASYLLVPEPCLWWLDFYAQFREHLETHYPVVFDLEDLCRIFALSPSTVAGETERITIPSAVPERATATFSRGGNGSGRHLQQAGSKAPPSSPALTGLDGNREFTAGSDGRPGILVLGVYLATRANNVEALVTAYAQARRYNVTQRWIALGGTPPSDAVARVTVQTIPELTAKYQLLNDLLGREDLSRYQYLLTTDDDIALPEQFIDRFIALQADLEFAIAQPARTVNSFIDHPIVQQQWGVLARQTRFVEAGPLVSFHRSAFSLILPFDLTSPMGWGYENVWSRLAAEHGLKMGIIDGLPIEHQMRQRGAYYDCAEAERGRRALFQRTRHFTFGECFRVTDVIAFQESPNGNRSNCAATERGHSHV